MPPSRDPSARSRRHVRNGAMLAANQATQLLNFPLLNDVTRHVHDLFVALQPEVLQAPRNNDLSARELAKRVDALVATLEDVAVQIDALAAISVHEGVAGYCMLFQQLYEYLQQLSSEIRAIHDYKFSTKIASQNAIRESILQKKDELVMRLATFGLDIGVYNGRMVALAMAEATENRSELGRRLDVLDRRHQRRRHRRLMRQLPLPKEPRRRDCLLQTHVVTSRPHYHPPMMAPTPSGDRETVFTDDSNPTYALDGPEWPSQTLTLLRNELRNIGEPNTRDLLSCGITLDEALKISELDSELVRPKLALGREWRRLYTDIILLHCLEILCESTQINTAGEETAEISSTTAWEDAVRQLDLTIVLAGAPGEGRLDLVLACIGYIQNLYLPLHSGTPKSTSPPPQQLPPQLGTLPVPVVHPAPSFSSFSKLAHNPFALPGLASSWPATSLWPSRDYLRSCGGRGRVVPIERGGDYRTGDWGVELMPWDEFLDNIGWGTGIEDDGQKLYLAQHSLFTQFPKLRADIVVPDYVYIDPPPASGYTGPPGNDEQLVINAWCGGQGANSPAHTASTLDPYYNIYVQVVGHKSIWLAPPEASPGIYAYTTRSDVEGESNRDPKREGMLGNTSSIDVFALSTNQCDNGAEPIEAGVEAKYPLFYEHALPLAQSITLGPGDALVIPPGWWHAMRGVGGGSFSVSFWF